MVLVSRFTLHTGEQSFTMLFPCGSLGLWSDNCKDKLHRNHLEIFIHNKLHVFFRNNSSIMFSKFFDLVNSLGIQSTVLKPHYTSAIVISLIMIKIRNANTPKPNFRKNFKWKCNLRCIIELERCRNTLRVD